jgi:polysaccharide biosynthesis transport protein
MVRETWNEVMEGSATISKAEDRRQFSVPAVSPEGGSAADLLLLLWRRKALLIGTIVLVTGFAVLSAFHITPRYAATARLMIDAAPQTAGASSFAQALSGNQRTQVFAEIEVMRSDRLVKEAVDRLGLVRDAEFNRTLRKGVLDAVAAFEQARVPVGILRSMFEDPASDEERAARVRQEVNNAFRKRLDIRPSGASNVVSVSFESTDPRQAARVVNTFTDIYIADNLDRRFRIQAQTRDWLDQRIGQLRETVLASERAVSDFLSSRGLIETGRNAVVDRQFVDVSQQLTSAKAQYAERQTRLEQVYRLRDSEQGLSAVREIRSSPLIQRLRDQEVALERKAAELENRFGERHPTMINLRTEIAELRQRSAEEEVRIVQELENEVRVARARVAALTGELQEIDEARVASGRDSIRLRQLQREAEANQRLYETYLAQLKQVSATPVSAVGEGVEVISPAQVPLGASYPRKGLIIGFGFLVSVMMGVFLVLLTERLDNGFRTAAQLERLTDIPVLGVVPRLVAAEKSGRAAIDLVVRDPGAGYTEAIRSLRTSLTVSNVDRPPRVVLIASSLPGEGKSSLAVALARQSAVSAVNGKVILIDCDLRRPTVSGMMELRAELGLTQLFAGETSFDEVVKIDPRTGLHVLPAVPGTPNPPELLNSQHMRALLDKLSATYDLVVLDSPALDAVSDARVLAHLADATVFVVQWETTPRQTAVGSLRQLASAGAAIAGVVLHKVNPRKQPKYAYEDLGTAA